MRIARLTRRVSWRTPCLISLPRRLSSTDSISLDLDVETTRLVYKLIRAFRDRGHYASNLDPLSKPGEERPSSWLPADSDAEHPDVVRLLRSFRRKKGQLDLEPFGLQTMPRDATFSMANEIKTSPARKVWTLNQLINFLVDTYCSTVGIEFSHIENDAQRTWLEEKVEGKYGPRKWQLTSPEAKREAWGSLLRTVHTATFLNSTFPNSKVFGIEGCEALIPGLQAILQRASSLGCSAIEMGMAHRGRMNVLHNFLNKPLVNICATFSESDPSELGDVKYHLGTRTQLKVRDTGEGGDAVERVVHVSLAANPSHLEAVNPVVIGQTKAKQLFISDKSMKKVCPLLLHGDASFSGQGIVPETMELSNLRDYTVGGSIHVVINNQVGFTTDPRSARTSYHCTNSCKGIGAPVFHVNADDVEAVVNVCRLAVEFRQEFGRDVVIDIVGYRRHGHNSLDDPSITQPLTYRLIDQHAPVLEIYTKHLIAQAVLSETAAAEASAALYREYTAAIKESHSYVPDPLEWLAANWQGAAIGSMLSTRPYNQTGTALSTLESVGRALLRVPADYELHPDIIKLLKSRQKMIETGEGITMAFAEALAFGCLMSKFSPNQDLGLRGLTAENRTLEAAHKAAFNTLDVQMQDHPSVHIRLSGQDVIRGTFNQRHAAIYDQASARFFLQLNNLEMQEQATISVCNSSLSEAAVLGFEYGYSLSNEMALTLWEAQFGDFSNNAQTVIDNFIASGESKWANRSSLVMLLPHGYDGQGPEHSSARVERYLQLVDDDEDSIPGKGAFSKAEIEAGFLALRPSATGVIEKAELSRALQRLNAGVSSERLDLTLTEIMTELGTSDNRGVVSKEAWFKLMEAWQLNNSERKGNLVIVVPTTPAQYFHALRRQIHRPFSKPLVCLSGKWLLHHKACVSRLTDMGIGTFFHRAILEGGIGDNTTRRRPLAPDQAIRKVVFCSGKIFYHLFHAREAAGITNVTFVRLEQIAPFPFDLIGPALARYKNAEIVWCQEEPKNMGAFSYVRPRIITTLRENGLPVKPVTFVGRKPSSSPASGGYTVHTVEQKKIIDEVLRPASTPP